MMPKPLFIITAICCALHVYSSCYSQNMTIPQKEFTISSTDSVNIEKGSFQKLNVWVLLSKSLVKTNVNVEMNISSALPEGVCVTFQPQQGDFDYCEATISVNPETKPGMYFIIASATIRNKTKGHIIKLTVPETQVPQITSGN
jgi:hypothetical protein